MMKDKGDNKMIFTKKLTKKQKECIFSYLDKNYSKNN